ncbi:hypothetical protein D3C84_856820 [compost metagenome]
MQQHGRAILVGKPAHGIAGDGLHLADFTAQMTEQVEVVDQVGQQHARTGLAAPGRFEITIGFAQLPERSDGAQPAQRAAVDPLMGAGDQRVVASMMTDQHRDAARLRGSHQLTGLIQVHTHRLFQQHRHTGSQAIERSAYMQRIGVGDNDGLWLRLIQHLTMIGEISHAPFLGEARRLRTGVGHSAQGRFSQGFQMLVVLLAHDASTDQGYTQW